MKPIYSQGSQRFLMKNPEIQNLLEGAKYLAPSNFQDFYIKIKLFRPKFLLYNEI